MASFLIFTFLPVLSACVSPALVCDAGSTGTRVYAFSSAPQSDRVEMKLIGKISPGLSTFALEKNLPAAADELEVLLKQGLDILGANTPVHILGTGGVRSLPEIAQSELWVDLRKLLSQKLTSELTLHAIHGTAEAFYGLVSANYLFPGGIGVLDLGGSSAEIAHAGEDGELGTDDDVLVTHPDLGTEKVRRLVDDACTPGSQSSGGSCRLKITKLLSEAQIDRILESNSQRFLGTSAFVYSLDFAAWLLSQTDQAHPFVSQYPTPTITSIRDACDIICAREVDTELYIQHSLTNAREADGRCFDVCYVAELLDSFGFKQDEQRVSFMLEVEGKEIEWTLGYYLTHVAPKTIHNNEEL